MTDPRVVEAKRAAAQAALGLVTPGMRLGLGTGSTAALFVEALAARLNELHGITAVVTSRATETLARDLGIRVEPLTTQQIDLAVDGTDLVDADLRLIKGGGGAHVRERIVAEAAGRFVVIADAGKKCAQLHGPLPVEVLPFGAEVTLRAIEAATGLHADFRRSPDGSALPSDNGNLLGDVHSGDIADPEGLSAELDSIPGVVGHGLFLGMADVVLLGSDDGSVERLAPKR